MSVKDAIILLFSENSSISMIRLMSLMALIASIGIAVYGVLNNVNVFDLASMFAGAAFTGKVAQKFAEKPSKETVIK